MGLFFFELTPINLPFLASIYFMIVVGHQSLEIEMKRGVEANEEQQKQESPPTMEAHSNMQFRTMKMRWTISDLPIHLAKANEKFYSPIFENDAGRWGLVVKKLAEIDSKNEKVEHLSVFVHMDKVNEMPSADVDFSVTLLNSHGDDEKVHSESHFERDGARTNTWGWNKLLLYAVVVDKRNGFLRGENDCLSIEAELKDGAMLNKMRPVGAALSRDFEHFFGEHLSDGAENGGGFADFTIKTKDGGVFRVHKAILAARSEMFRAMLDAQTTETRSHQMVVEDIDSSTMRALLLFLYTDRVDVDELREGKEIDLFIAADKYQLIELKEICARAFESSMSVDTVCEMLAMAEMHAAPELKTKLMHFISRNRELVVRTEGWKVLKRDDLHLIDDFKHNKEASPLVSEKAKTKHKKRRIKVTSSRNKAQKKPTKL